MSQETAYRLMRRAVFDEELGLHRICWVLESTCVICGCLLDTIFDEIPDKMTITEAQLVPCDECIEEEWKTMGEFDPELAASLFEPVD